MPDTASTSILHRRKKAFVEGSTHDLLSKLAVGERMYVEATLDNYQAIQRRLAAPRSRRPEALRDHEFSTQLFTALAANKAGDIRYLVCVERTK